MIRLEHVTKRYGALTAVADLCLTVEPRESVALWGANGAGKTTVIKCLLGLVRYTGSARVDDIDVARDGRRARRRMGYVPQELAFYPEMSVADTWRYFARLRGVRSDPETALRAVGLDDHGARPVGALSGGMKQRLAVSLALLGDPPVLILDEPTANLDAAARDQLLELLTDVRDAGKTVLFTSHRVEEVEALADWVLVMDGGRERERCPSGQLADVVGLRARLRVSLADGASHAAAAVLTSHGFAAHANGTGVLVEVKPGAKAEPIVALARSGIEVRDFHVE